MSAWNDFNDAEDQNLFDVIPAGTLVKVRLSIRPGGYNEPTMGWNDGYATCNDVTGAVYLNSEFVVLDGPYARRKVWTLIGLHSPKRTELGQYGPDTGAGYFTVGRGIRSDDRSPQAQKARQIQTFAELDGLEFVARVAVEPDQQGGEKNVIKAAVTPEHKQYGQLMGVVVNQAPVNTVQQQPAAQAQQGEQAQFPSEPPSWA